MKIGNKTIGLRRLKSSFFLHMYDNDTDVIKSYVLQFAARDMWLTPGCRYVSDFKLYGWLFIYFGYCVTEGRLYV